MESVSGMIAIISIVIAFLSFCVSLWLPLYLNFRVESTSKNKIIQDLFIRQLLRIQEDVNDFLLSIVNNCLSFNCIFYKMRDINMRLNILSQQGKLDIDYKFMYKLNKFISEDKPSESLEKTDMKENYNPSDNVKSHIHNTQSFLYAEIIKTAIKVNNTKFKSLLTSLDISR